MLSITLYFCQYLGTKSNGILSGLDLRFFKFRKLPFLQKCCGLIISDVSDSDTERFLYKIQNNFRWYNILILSKSSIDLHEDLQCFGSFPFRWIGPTESGSNLYPDPKHHNYMFLYNKIQECAWNATGDLVQFQGDLPHNNGAQSYQKNCCPKHCFHYRHLVSFPCTVSPRKDEIDNRHA